MIVSGCPYACLVTGEALLFLHIDQASPTDLHYFLAEPQLDASSGPDGGLDISKTMVAQLLSFCLIGYPPRRYDQDWIRNVQALASMWTINFEDVVYETPRKLREIEARIDKADLSYKGYGGPYVNQSPYQTRQRKAKLASGCATEGPAAAREDSDSSNEDSHLQGSSPKPRSSKHPSSQQKPQSKHGVKLGSIQGSSKQKGQQRQYCTQACLFGLVHRLPVDDACPNAASHSRSANGNTHALTRPRLAALLQQ